ncbi:PPE domain-containing protein [Kibdelosporangium persicum]|uniref:PPE domain-containing protein n=1 Tax=Kibdelosporangium persicum TaxID=2698649 RepID=A0ABX2F0T4_9PSEU|nr:PPE domain-containing protein [Kibdelosporangium persicum]NRN64739.1 PPE domain-containing protein [Kibdelosporangium persicum]
MAHEEMTRWRGFSHAELYAQLHSGPGAAASAVPAQRWTDMASIFATIDQDLTKAISDSKAEWQGQAATLAFAQLGDVVAWASRVGQNAASMRASVEQQADHVSQARANMPVPGENPTPQPDAATAPAAQVLALQSDHEPVERATSDAARRAYEVMQTYENDTAATMGGLSTFDEHVDTKAVVHVQHESQHVAVGAMPETETVLRTPTHGPRDGTAQVVSQASAEFFGVPADEPEVRARPIAGEPVTNGGGGGSAAAAPPPQRSSLIRRAPARNQASVDAHPAAPIAPATATTGNTVDRAASRRFGGEPLIPQQLADDAVEPPKRRRDRHEEEKITERVEGADAEVAPPVIGNGPYRP